MNNRHCSNIQTYAKACVCACKHTSTHIYIQYHLSKLECAMELVVIKNTWSLAFICSMLPIDRNSFENWAFLESLDGFVVIRGPHMLGVCWEC